MYDRLFVLRMAEGSGGGKNPDPFGFTNSSSGSSSSAAPDTSKDDFGMKTFNPLSPVSFRPIENDDENFEISEDGQTWKKVRIASIGTDPNDKDKQKQTITYVSEDESVSGNLAFNDDANTVLKKYIQRYIKDFEEQQRKKDTRQMIAEGFAALDDDKLAERRDSEDTLPTSVDVRENNDRLTPYKDTQGKLTSEINIVSRDGSFDILVYSRDDTEDSFPVQDPKYTKEDLELLAQEKVKIFQNGKEVEPKDIDKLELRTMEVGAAVDNGTTINDDTKSLNGDDKKQSIASDDGKNKEGRFKKAAKTAAMVVTAPIWGLPVLAYLGVKAAKNRKNSQENVPLISSDDEGDPSRKPIKPEKEPKPKGDLKEFLIKYGALIKLKDDEKHRLHTGEKKLVSLKGNTKDGHGGIRKKTTNDTEDLVIGISPESIEIESSKGNHGINFSKMREALREFHKNESPPVKIDTIVWRVNEDGKTGSATETLKGGKKTIVLKGNVKYEFNIKLDKGEKAPFLYLDKDNKVKLMVDNDKHLETMKLYAKGVSVGDPAQELSEILKDTKNVKMRQSQSQSQSPPPSFSNLAYNLRTDSSAASTSDGLSSGRDSRHSSIDSTSSSDSTTRRQSFAVKEETNRRSRSSSIDSTTSDDNTTRLHQGGHKPRRSDTQNTRM